MVSYNLTFQAVNIPTNSGGASVTVEEDSNTDGTVENSDTVSLSDGQTTYTTSDVFAGSGQVRLDFDIGPPSDVTTTASVTGPIDVTVVIYRYSTITANSTINSTRQTSKPRQSDVYGDSAIDSTRQTSKPRQSDVYGDGAIDNEIIGFIDTAIATSHVYNIHSFAENERTSLELLDFDLSYDEEKRAWYTQWFPETKITGSEDDIGLISTVAPQGKEPAARITVQYSTNGRDVTDEAPPVFVNKDELVKNIPGIPIDEDGYYRLKIEQYSGYNDITNINLGFIS